MKTRIICFLLVFVIASSFAGWTQSSPGLKTLVPVSPNAAALGKYGEIPVSLYTGIPNINIPLYTLKGRELEMPITLNYHAGGIRVEEIASWVGSGWSLNAGGVITRTIRGMPDDAGRGFFSNRVNMTALAKKYMTMTSPYQSFTIGVGNADPNDLLTLDGIRQNLVDAEPDIFYFNFGKYSGKFFMNENGNFVASPLEALNVQYATGTDGQVKQWIITTPDGIKYVFGSTVDGSRTALENNINGAQWPTATTAWYLMEMYSPYNDKISLNYTNIQYSYTSRSSEVLNRIVDATPSGAPPGLPSPDRKLILNQMTVPRLTAITSANGMVSFGAGADRTDLPGEASLASINIFNNQDLVNPLKQWLFSYDYSTNRLTLNSLHEYSGDGVTSGQSYSFFYNGGLPNADPHGTAINSQDLWGYYNGVSNAVFPQGYTTPTPAFGTVTVQGADRHSDENYMKNGTLYKIVYPTGGYSQFDYEANRVFGNPQTSSIPVAGVPKQAGSTAFFYNTSFSQTFTIVDPDPATGKVAVTVTALSMDHQSCPLDPYGFSQCYTAKLQGINGTSYPLTVFKDGQTNISLLPGTYVISGAGTNLSGQANNVYRFYMNWLEYPPPPSSGGGMINLAIGGLRIKRITNYDGISTNVTRYAYNKFNDTASSGVLVNQPYNYANVFDQDQKFCTSSGFTIGSATYLQVRSYPLIPLMPTQGAPIGYQNVTRLVGENGENGKEEYTFTTANDFPDELLAYRPYPPGCSFDWRRGQLLKTTTYKNSNGIFIPIQYKANKYNNLIKTSVGYGLTVEVDAYHLGSGCVVNSSAGDYFAGPYRTVSEFQYLQSDTTVVYDQNIPSSYSQTVHNYTYDTVKGHYQMASTVTWNSKNQLEETDYYYPRDLSLSGYAETARTALISQFILTPVLDTKVIRNGIQIQESRNNYKVFSNGIPLPESIDLQIGSNPIERRVEFLNYDNFGNITQQHKANDVLHSYIWDYQSQYPVAECVNADSTSIAYTSFEADGRGNWTLGNAFTDPVGFTGNYSYNLQNGTIGRSGLSSSVAYIVSYWTSTGHSLTVSGTTSVTQGKTIGGWTYFEHAVSGVASITISGAGNIDEVRLYPGNAQMTTYTYRPLVGMTSQCDVNNRVTYYTYDGLGRLSYIKDQDGNVVKRYCYNYNGQTASCQLLPPQPVVVSNSTNRQMQISFVNVNNGYTVNFSVPAGASNMTVGTVPASTYNVTMTPANYTNTYPVVFSFNGSTQQYFATVAFGNQPVTAPVNITTAPPPYYPVTVSNGTNQQMSISFTDVSSGGNWTYTVAAGASNLNVGSIPGATYNVTMSPSNYTATYPIVYTFGSYTQTYYATVAFGNVQVTGAVSITTNPPPYYPVIVTNSTNETMQIVYTNSATNATYTFTAAPGVINSTVGSVPAGTFGVTIGPTSPSSTYPVVYTLNGWTQTYYATVGYGAFSVGGTQIITMAPPPDEPIVASNNTTQLVTLTFTNKATNLQYTMTVPVGTSNAQVGTVPAGTYDVLMSNAAPNSAQPILWQIGNASQTYYGPVAFGGAVINTTCTINIIRQY